MKWIRSNKIWAYFFQNKLDSATKGQLISKAIYGLLTSANLICLFFLLFTANNSNSSVRFLEESIARQSAFRN